MPDASDKRGAALTFRPIDRFSLRFEGADHVIPGRGWGNMPEPSVRADFAAGRLVRLQLPEVRGGAYPLHAIYRTDSPPGTAAAWMIQKFVDQAAKERTKATHSPGNRSRPIRRGRKARIK